MPSIPGPASALVALAGAFSHGRMRWFVFGAQAVLLWGRPRFTADVDVTVALDGSTVQELMERLRRAGFVLRAEATDDFIATTRVVPVSHESSGIPVDVVLAGPGLEEEFLGRARVVDVEGAGIPFISAEDLVVTKLLAGRPKDLDDVQGVVEAQGTRFDVGAVRKTLRAIEDALGRSDLVRALEAELTNLRRP